MSKRFPTIARSLLLFVCSVIIGVCLAFLVYTGLSSAARVMFDGPAFNTQYDTVFIWIGSVVGILYLAWAIRDIKLEIDNGY